MKFYIVTNAVARVALEEICRPQEAHHRMVWVAGERDLILYMDERRTAGRYHIWV